MGKLKYVSLFGKLYDNYYLLLINTDKVHIDPDRLTHRFSEALNTGDPESVTTVFLDLVGRYKHKYLEVCSYLLTDDEYRQNKLLFLAEMQDLINEFKSLVEDQGLEVVSTSTEDKSLESLSVSTLISRLRE